MKARKMKKNYKANLMWIAVRLPAVLPTKRARRAWVREVAAKWQRMRKGRKRGYKEMQDV